MLSQLVVAASYLQLIDQHCDGVELVLVSLSLHLDCRGMYEYGKGHVLAWMRCAEDRMSVSGMES